MKSKKTQKPKIGFPAGSSILEVQKSYVDFLKALKTRIQQERLRVVLSSNTALINLYWDIGKVIIEKQTKEGW